MKKILACTLAVVMLLALLAGCGSAKADLGGKYVATSCSSTSEGTVYDPGGDYLYLSSDGGGYFHFMDDDIDLEWTLKGDAFTFTGSDDDTFTGTYADGVIEGSIGGLDYVFELGAEVPETNAKEEAAAPDEEAAPEEDPATDDGVTDVAAPAGDFQPVEGDLGDYYVAILGAEALEDYDGEPAIRIYYSFTNNSDEPESASWALELSAEEAGYDLDTTYVASSDDVEEYYNYSRDVYPGVTILCEQIYSCNPDDDIITFSVTDWWDETDVLTCDFSYSNLPGRPDPIEYEPITEAVITTELGMEGDISEDAHVVLSDSYDLVESYDGIPSIRIYMDFTNNGEEDASCWWDCTVYVYQDGVELLTTIPDESVDSDDMFNEDIAPGETAACSECYELLNTTDPVEVIISDYGDNPIGTAFFIG